jgi:phage baseplate assembly protein W
MATKPLYSGLSTVNGVQNLYNIDLVNQDLLNNINTRKGERLMQPEYGSIVWDLLFELKSPSIISQIQADLTNIINAEPRVSLQQMEIAEQENGYVAFITLYYVNFKTTAQLQVDFNQSTAQAGQNTTGS